MTNVFVGFQNNQKNCRRSLKPPGGGTSDFFNFGSITDDHKKTDIKTQVQDKKDTTHIVEVEVDSQVKGLEVENESNPTDDQLCENLNDMTVDEICEIDDNEDESNEASAADKSANNTTIKSTITMNNTVTRTEVISEKKSSNRVPPGGHSKGLW